jgi:acetate kinase
MRVLVLNAGSSSQKSCLYELGESLPELPPAPAWEAHIEWKGSFQKVRLKVRSAQGETVQEQLKIGSRSTAIQHMLNTLSQGPTRVLKDFSEVDVVGHRVVHGGEVYRDATLVTPEVKQAIARLAVLAPQHNPANLEGIEATQQAFPARPHVAVFDTAFHSLMPPAAVVYSGPYAWFEQGIRRYGFQGISFGYCSERAARILGKDLRSLRLVACHLGHGCSLAAIREGRSVDTTMGFTPLEGLMMGSRSGTVDPGILVYLLREKGYDAERLDRVLNRESGLLGISGVSDDMREVLAAMQAGNSRARLAFEMYVQRLRFHIAAMAASLGGLDALVFTAGIGENSPEVRTAACRDLGFLNLKIDPQKNAQSPVDSDIATQDSAVRILVVAAREDWAIAQECWRLIRAKPQELQA